MSADQGSSEPPAVRDRRQIRRGIASSVALVAMLVVAAVVPSSPPASPSSDGDRVAWVSEHGPDRRDHAGHLDREDRRHLDAQDLGRGGQPDGDVDGHTHDRPAGSLGLPEESADDVVTVLTGDHPDGYVVDETEIALIDTEVSMGGNLVVEGVLRMRPGGHLTFRGTDMEAYVGADDEHHQPIVDADVGLWVTARGALDIQGTPKAGWNRTGEHPSWEPEDEYWISPTEPGDFDPRPWKPGDPIPQHDPRVPAAEVINVTRDIVIEGPGHIHIHAQRPQRIEYVQLRDMGVSNEAHEGPVLGRYALHLHHGLDGSRGTVITGVASIGARGRVFVPHLSHGITMTDLVAVNSYAEVLWWDKGDKTEDLLVDGLAASGVHMPDEVAGDDRNLPVAVLGSNENAVIRDSAVSGSRGRDGAMGFHWNTSRAHRHEHRAVWDFHDNVTHNNEGHGLRFWFNDDWSHHVRDTAIYNNGGFGIENGAYTNAIRYTGVEVLGNGAGGILHHSSSNERSDDGGPSRYTDVTIEGPDPAIEIGRLRGTPKTRQEFIGCDLDGGQLVLDRGGNTREPFIARFRDCGDLGPDDIVLPNGRASSAMEGSSIEIEHPDGRRWEVTIEDGQLRTRQHS